MHRKDARVSGLNCLKTLLALCCLALAACSGSTRVTGKVVHGPVGLAVVVDPGDERLDKPGIPAAEVALLRDTGPGSAGGAVIVKSVSDEAGNFTLTLAKGQHPGGAVMVRVKGEGFFLSRSRAFLPRGTQQLLCTVIEQKEAPSP